MDDQNFILIESGAKTVPEFLVRNVDGFSDSGEYRRLDDEDRKSAGIVCGAFANYLSRIHAEGDTNLASQKAFEAIEALSSIQDSEVENLVVTEILENIHFDAFPDLVQMLGDRSKTLYDRWLA